MLKSKAIRMRNPGKQGRMGEILGIIGKVLKRLLLSSEILLFSKKSCTPHNTEL